jgi:DNA-binding LytR/AlgR family response regulator
MAAGALGASILLAGQEYFYRHWGGGPNSYDDMLLAQLIGVVVWIVLAPVLVVPLARRFPLDERRRPSHLVIHAAAIALVPMVHIAIVAMLFASHYYGWSPAAMYDVARDRMHTVYAWGVLAYAAIVGGIHLKWRLTMVDGIEQPTAGQALAPAKYSRRIVVKNDGRLGVVPVEQIDWLEASDNHVVVHTRAAKHLMRVPLSRLTERLDPRTFVRVHRSTVVNVDRVREVQPWFRSELVVILKDDTRLTIGRRYRDEFLRALEG